MSINPQYGVDQTFYSNLPDTVQLELPEASTRDVYCIALKDFLPYFSALLVQDMEHQLDLSQALHQPGNSSLPGAVKLGGASLNHFSPMFK